jgi:hypothetical protein
MAHKKKHGNPVPPSNQSQAGPGLSPGQSGQEAQETASRGAPFDEQDPKRRL